MPTIATSVELIFDEQLSAKIRGVWDSFTVGKIRYQPHAEQGHPHITVSVREKNDENWLPIVQSLARKMSPFEVMFSSVGMFLRLLGWVTLIALILWCCSYLQNRPMISSRRIASS